MSYGSWRRGAGILLLGAVVLCSCEKTAQNAAPGTSAPAAADQGAHTTFATPEDATDALAAALSAHDTTAVRDVLGPGTGELLSSGDPVADGQEREAFLAAYRTFHALVAGGPNDLVLLVGEERWPLPIPLVRSNGRWSFDGAAGAEEILVRRIGANELRTIDVMRGVIAAEDDYAATGHDGAPAGVFAQRLRSTPGKQDGLYWDVRAGEPPSPAGPFLAAASSEGYGSSPHDVRAPYHGYLYRLLTAQGPAAQGGAVDYLADGKLTRGFALLAYPSGYGASGVMTFIVNQDGIVWQRDLGENTAKVAAAIRQFNPDSTWTPIAPEE